MIKYMTVWLGIWFCEWFSCIFYLKILIQFVKIKFPFFLIEVYSTLQMYIIFWLFCGISINRAEKIIFETLGPICFMQLSLRNLKNLRYLRLVLEIWLIFWQNMIFSFSINNREKWRILFFFILVFKFSFCFDWKSCNSSVWWLFWVSISEWQVERNSFYCAWYIVINQPK